MNNIICMDYLAKYKPCMFKEFIKIMVFTMSYTYAFYLDPSVHEKEKLRGRDPDKEDEEGGFGEYTRT